MPDRRIGGTMPDTQSSLEPLKPGGMVTSAHIVIDLAERRIVEGKRKRGVEKCGHKRIIYSRADRTVWCEDCERNIDGFDAFLIYTDHLHKMQGELLRLVAAVEDEKKSTLISRAAKALDRAWRGKPVAVPCPHCRGGLLPEDFADGEFGFSSRDIELARRKKTPPVDTAWR